MRKLASCERRAEVCVGGFLEVAVGLEVHNPQCSSRLVLFDSVNNAGKLELSDHE